MDATPADVARVRRQLGPTASHLDREPDITVRFVDRADPGPLTFVGVGRTGFDDDGFFVLHGRAARRDGPGPVRPTRARARDRLRARHPGRAPPAGHRQPDRPDQGRAAAARVRPSRSDGEGSWSPAGPRAARPRRLLAATSHGARYVGDEWVYLPPDGRMLGLSRADPAVGLAARPAARPARLPYGGRAPPAARLAAAAAARRRGGRPVLKGSGARAAGRPGTRVARPTSRCHRPTSSARTDGAERPARRGRARAEPRGRRDHRLARGAPRDLRPDGRLAGRGARAADGALPAVPLRLPRPACAAAGAPASWRPAPRRAVDHVPSAKVTHPYPCDLAVPSAPAVHRAAALRERPSPRPDRNG